MTQQLLVFCNFAKWLGFELDALLARDTPPAAGDEPIDFYERVEQYEVELITWALRRTAGQQRKAAKLLNIKSTTLHSKIRRYKINVGALGPFGMTDDL